MLHAFRLNYVQKTLSVDSEDDGEIYKSEEIENEEWMFHLNEEEIFRNVNGQDYSVSFSLEMGDFRHTVIVSTCLLSLASKYRILTTDECFISLMDVDCTYAQILNKCYAFVADTNFGRC